MSERATYSMAGPLDGRGYHQRHQVTSRADGEAHRVGTVYLAVCGARCAPGPDWYVRALEPCAECARRFPTQRPPLPRIYRAARGTPRR